MVLILSEVLDEEFVWYQFWIEVAVHLVFFVPVLFERSAPSYELVDDVVEKSKIHQMHRPECLPIELVAVSQLQIVLGQELVVVLEVLSDPLVVLALVAEVMLLSWNETPLC